MDTIIRTSRGNYVIVDETVKYTVLEMIKKPGSYSIDDIKAAINNQLPDPREHLTRKMVVRGMVRLLGKSNK